jgi:hypothetical protein
VETYYTLQEAAELLGIDIANLHIALKAKTLPCAHHYGRHVMSRNDIDAYRQRTRPAAHPSQPIPDTGPNPP